VDAESDGSKKNAVESTVGSVSADELREVFGAFKMASHNDCEVAEGGIAIGKSSDVNSVRIGGLWCKQSNPLDSELYTDHTKRENESIELVLGRLYHSLSQQGMILDEHLISSQRQGIVDQRRLDHL
jgi:hypothetical protein